MSEESTRLYLTARFKDEHNKQVCKPLRVGYGQNTDASRRAAINAFINRDSIRKRNAAHIYVEFPNCDERRGQVVAFFDHYQEREPGAKRIFTRSRFKMVTYDLANVPKTTFSKPETDRKDPDRAAYDLFETVKRKIHNYKSVIIYDMHSGKIYENNIDHKPMRWAFGKRVMPITEPTI